MEMEDFRDNIEEYTRPETFYSILRANTQTDKTFIVYITAHIDIIHGDKEKYWDADCEEVRKDVEKHILKETNLLVIQASIKDMDEWESLGENGKWKNIFLNDPMLKAKKIPCLFLMKGDKILTRIETLEDFKNEENLKKMANYKPTESK